MSELSIPSLILDPENEQQVILRAYEAIRSSSNGLINDLAQVVLLLLGRRSSICLYGNALVS